MTIVLLDEKGCHATKAEVQHARPVLTLTMYSPVTGQNKPAAERSSRTRRNIYMATVTIVTTVIDIVESSIQSGTAGRNIKP